MKTANIIDINVIDFNNIFTLIFNKFVNDLYTYSLIDASSIDEKSTPLQINFKNRNVKKLLKLNILKRLIHGFKHYKNSLILVQPYILDKNVRDYIKHTFIIDETILIKEIIKCITIVANTYPNKIYYSDNLLIDIKNDDIEWIKQKYFNFQNLNYNKIKKYIKKEGLLLKDMV